MDKLGGLIESQAHFYRPGNNEDLVKECSLDKDQYIYFHRVLVPEWINKYWCNGMEYNGENLEHYLYEQHETEFRKYLHQLGYDAQECFVSYEVSSGGPREDGEEEWPEGRFKMGFDVFANEETEDKPATESGWAVFVWSYNTQGGGLCVEDAQYYKEEEYGWYFAPDNYRFNCKCTICLGQGMFYSFKSNRFGGDITFAEELGDGGYILRLD